MERFDAVVIGAGAAGMFCAAMAGQAGRRVLLLDNGKKPGRKILMSGGGRCNFTNLYVEPAAYLSQNRHFCKSALARYTQWDFIEMVGKHGITVNCIPPGRIHSEQIFRNYTPEYRAWQSENEIPVGRYGEPEELADLVAFLASPRAAYISGAVIPVDGGLRKYQF